MIQRMAPRQPPPCLRPGPSPAKLSRPHIDGAIARARLFGLLDESAEYPLVWISSPPGAGKTTLVASWLDARTYPACWYHADPGDTDPGTTFAYLSGLIRATVPKGARSMPMFSPEHATDVPAFARLFFRRFFSLLPQGARVVIDNHHEAAGAAFDALLREAATEVPRGMQLLVVSRSDVPAALSRALANRLVWPMGWDALRLTKDETGAFLQRIPSPAAEDAPTLNALSGGWAAGLVLLSRAMDRPAAIDGKQLRLDLAGPSVHEGDKLWEYAVLVTDVSHPLEAIAQLYRDRADAQNAFDELKNQLGLGGFTTQDINRCQTVARTCALVYNWWSWYCRAAHPGGRLEAITSRPLLLAAVGKAASHANQTLLYLRPCTAGQTSSSG
jgi:ATP/maltotriose-dependent transcriptional regulator MalT